MPVCNILCWTVTADGGMVADLLAYLQSRYPLYIVQKI